MTIYFQHSSNHWEKDALKQMLQKRNQIEDLEISGHQRIVRKQQCSNCKSYEHNKRTCPQKKPSQEMQS